MHVNNISPIELIYMLIAVIPALAVVYNIVNCLSDIFLVQREKVNGGIMAAAKDALHTQGVFAVITAAVMTMGGVAFYTPPRPDAKFQWAGLIFGLAIIVIEFAVLYGTVREAASRRASVAAYQRPGESRQESLRRVKTQRRRADDPEPGTNIAEVTLVKTVEPTPEGEPDKELYTGEIKLPPTET